MSTLPQGFPSFHWVLSGAHSNYRGQFRSNFILGSATKICFLFATIRRNYWIKSAEPVPAALMCPVENAQKIRISVSWNSTFYRWIGNSQVFNLENGFLEIFWIILGWKSWSTNVKRTEKKTCAWSDFPNSHGLLLNAQWKTPKISFREFNFSPFNGNFSNILSNILILSNNLDHVHEYKPVMSHEKNRW